MTTQTSPQHGRSGSGLGLHERIFFSIAFALMQDLAIYWILHRAMTHHLARNTQILLALAGAVLLGLALAALGIWTPRWDKAPFPHVAVVWRAATWFVLFLAGFEVLAIEPFLATPCLAMLIATGGPPLWGIWQRRRELRRAASGRWRRGSYWELPREHRRVSGVAGRPAIPVDRAEFGDGT